MDLCICGAYEEQINCYW